MIPPSRVAQTAVGERVAHRPGVEVTVQQIVDRTARNHIELTKHGEEHIVLLEHADLQDLVRVRADPPILDRLLDRRSFSAFTSCLKHPETRAAGRVIDHIGAAVEEVPRGGLAEVGTLKRSIPIPVRRDMAGQHRHTGINESDAGLEPGPSPSRHPARPRHR